MFTVYALYSLEFDKIYVGYTSNLTKRLLQHNELSIKGYTVRYRPWVVVFKEEYQTKTEAIKREKQLKSSRGRAYIREQIGKRKW